MSDHPSSSQEDPRARGNRRVALFCAAFAAVMVGVAFAAVPLYDLFCKMTGFGGTPMVRTLGAIRVIDRTVAVRFDANVAPGLPWTFAPEVNQVDVKLGETTTVLYRVRNDAAVPTTGVATFNVQPPLAGAYFAKLQCFCFQEQTLQPGETIESAVVFYVDPALADDPNTKDINAITLSYTYFAAKGKTGVAAAGAATARN